MKLLSERDENINANLDFDTTGILVGMKLLSERDENGYFCHSGCRLVDHW